MPIINDATVINQAYGTNGNGGRKLVRLDNGWLVTVSKNVPFTKAFLQVSKNNGSTFEALTEINTGTNCADVCVANSGSYVHVLILTGTDSSVGLPRFISFDATKVTSTIASTELASIDVGQNSTQSVSLTINEEKTELHAAWSSKNSTYPNSFNIRYAKGVINADGSVTWGAVEQWTNVNSMAYDFKNPSIVYVTNKPVVIFDYYSNTANSYIVAMSTDGMKNNPSGAFLKNYTLAYTSGGNYTQFSPSAIFVPKNINGLANGRIWVAWHGMDSTDTSVENIRVSYSDDGGITWSAMQKLTSGNTLRQQYPSITSNKNGDIYIVFQGYDGSYWQVRKLSFVNSVWGSPVTITNMNTVSNSFSQPVPSAIFDSSLNFSSPLFIYRNLQNSKVGFYGTWSVTNTSVPQGSIGAVTDKNNLLTYSITTDGDMGEIVEKVNNVIVGTKTAISGESLTVRLTQEQWDAVKFGNKYELKTINLSSADLWEQGSISNIKGAMYTPAVSSTRIRVKNAISVEPNKEITVKMDGHVFFIIEYGKNGIQTVDAHQSALSGDSYMTSSKADHIRIFIQKNPAGDIYPSNIAETNINILYRRFIENTLTIEMGSEKWTYTFDKHLAPDADILSTVKALKESQDIYLPAVKDKLSRSVRDKGGVVSGDASFEDMGNAIDGIELGKKRASGEAYVDADGMLRVAELSFRPSYIAAYRTNQKTTSLFYSEILNGQDSYFWLSNNVTTLKYVAQPQYINATGFNLSAPSSYQYFTWVAYE